MGAVVPYRSDRSDRSLRSDIMSTSGALGLILSPGAILRVSCEPMALAPWNNSSGAPFLIWIGSGTRCLATWTSAFAALIDESLIFLAVWPGPNGASEER